MATELPRSRRNVVGILLLDKPSGVTSNQVLQRAKRLFNAEKAGHTGSLDPLATGMLPICFGAGTKISGLLLHASKTYRVTACFGIATETGDADGRVIARGEPDRFSDTELEQALARFRGAIDQVPPMYSAIKHAGRRLYELARKGQQVERIARRVDIHDLRVESVAWPEVTLNVSSSKGTYVRTLVEDIAKAMGTVAHVAALRRLAVEPFTESQMVGLAALEASAGEGTAALDAHLLGPDAALENWPSVRVDGEASTRLRQGQRVPASPDWPLGEVRIYTPENGFLGLGEVLPGGELRPKKLFSS